MPVTAPPIRPPEIRKTKLCVVSGSTGQLDACGIEETPQLLRIEQARFAVVRAVYSMGNYDLSMFAYHFGCAFSTGDDHRHDCNGAQ
jgi:hypothetical protein